MLTKTTFGAFLKKNTALFVSVVGLYSFVRELESKVDVRSKEVVWT